MSSELLPGDICSIGELNIMVILNVLVVSKDMKAEIFQASLSLYILVVILFRYNNVPKNVYHIRVFIILSELTSVRKQGCSQV